MCKISRWILIILLLLSLVACGTKEGSPEPYPEEPTYILNKNSHVYHDPDCKYLPDEKNQVEIEYADIEHNPDYRPCGHCKPE